MIVPPPGVGSKSCVWCENLCGPLGCTSTNRCGGSQTAIRVRRRIGMPWSLTRCSIRLPGHRDGLRRCHAEAKPRRGKRLEVVGVAEEGKTRSAGAREVLLAGEDVKMHAEAVRGIRAFES